MLHSPLQLSINGFTCLSEEHLRSNISSWYQSGPLQTSFSRLETLTPNC